MALRRSKEPVSIQIRQLSTNLQIEGAQQEKLIKARLVKEVPLEKLQAEVKLYAEKVEAQRCAIADIEGQLRALGSG
eukprot:1914011-Pyramimonas_sp.AAC.1